MIPTIEQICDDLKAGRITLIQAIKWLLMHQGQRSLIEEKDNENNH